MNPSDQKKRFRVFAKQLKNGTPPSKEQTEYLIYLFEGLGNGRDPRRILGLQYEDGKSEQDEQSRINISLVMHWIAGATAPRIDKNGKALKPEIKMKEAFEMGSTLARRLFNIPENSDSYDPAYIKKLWYASKQNIDAKPSDQDSFYEYEVPSKK